MRGPDQDFGPRRLWAIRIKTLRAKMGVSRRNFGADLNVGIRTVVQWENAECEGPLEYETTKRLCALEDYWLNDRVPVEMTDTDHLVA